MQRLTGLLATEATNLAVRRIVTYGGPIPMIKYHGF